MHPSKQAWKQALFPLQLLFLIAICVLFTQPLAFSQSKYPLVTLLRCTRDQSILEAFDRMVGSPGEPSLQIIVDKPVRVFFKDLGSLSKRVKNYDALSWLSAQGEQVIFINEKHRNAPPEALAAIIAHEAMHNDVDNSIQEEIAGWKKELEVWQQLKHNNPNLASIPDGQYPLVDRLNRIEVEYKAGRLDNFLRNNPGYSGLPEHSPGF